MNCIFVGECALKHIEIYTDGACSGNPGPGGWGAVLSFKNYEKELFGFESNTTNNRMEILAVINALKALKEPCNVVVHTDSKYVCDAVSLGWIKRWKENNWMRNKREPAVNSDLWEILLSLLKVHNVKFNWVKGHSGNPQNERCDRLAVYAIKRSLSKNSLD